MRACAVGEKFPAIYHFVMQVQESGMTDTVCTLFELRAGDDTVNEG